MEDKKLSLLDALVMKQKFSGDVPASVAQQVLVREAERIIDERSHEIVEERYPS